MDPQTTLYLQYYTKQAGGSLPIFSGARRGQYGSGLGDILRGIFRSVLPIAMRGAATFLGETMRAREEGSTWKNAALGALPGTAQNIASSAVAKLKSNSQGEAQQGAGHSRKKRHHKIAKQRGYKRRRKSHQRNSTGSKKIKFLNF